MDIIIVVLMLAVVVEALIQYVKSFVAAFSTGADMFSALGIAFDWPTIGVVLTGIFLSRGSNYISDFIKKMRGVSQNDN